MKRKGERNGDRKEKRARILKIEEGINSSLDSQQLDVNTDVELIAVKIVNNYHPIILVAVYRPPANDQPYMDELSSAITRICKAHPTSPIWICGDTNLPDIDWETTQIVSHQYRVAINETFLDTLADCGLDQVVNFPTRGDNVLDIIATNRPSLVSRCEGMPGLSDHDTVFLELNTKATRRKQVRRKIFLWNKANFDIIRIKTKEFSDQFVDDYSHSTPVELLASELQKGIEKIIAEHVPSKFTSTRFSQPWINSRAKRILSEESSGI